HGSMEPQPAKKKAKPVPVLRYYFNAAKKYPLALALVFIGNLIIQGAGLASPLYLQKFVNVVAHSTPSEAVMGSLFTLLAIFAVINFIGWIGQRVQMLSVMRIEADVMVDLSNQAFSNLLRHSHDFFVSNFAGTLTRRVNRYSRAFEDILDIFVFSFFSTAVFGTGVIVVLMQRNIYLGLGLLAWVIVFITIQVIMARVRQPLRKARAEEDSKVTGVLSDAVSNQSTITTFASVSQEEGVFAGAVARWKTSLLRSWYADALIFAIQGILSIIIEFALLAGGVILWRQGLMTVGDFVLIQVYVLGLMDRIWNLGNSMRRLYDAFSDAYEMVSILETPVGIKDAPDAKPLVVSEGRIDLDDVLFEFNESAAVLKDLTLSIGSHEKVALVGPSGAGKSTITKLLLRFYDVTSGSISIDGQDISKVTQESLRRSIAFVPQEPVLFHRSLMDNIRYGRPTASDEEVMDAAKKARCHDFITALPEGYGTHVGERGVKLSGGERQRVAIARALLKDAPILILDEATSALDSESEHLIQEALTVLMEGKTVVVIAHRLSTIMSMDRIVVLEHGAIAAEGTHTELLEEGGLYHKLWSIQAGSFVADEG
ncbi:MAG TPA: ABC transporter ATP-binding protein, partial [Candidatus Paceibacterota bacterium]|nr:ABC transporter ATP-binding protein [Candidatus Paceibacterota bacterium]